MRLRRQESAASDPLPVLVAHDYLTQLGGAERVALTIARYYKAPLFTFVADPAVVDAWGDSLDIRTSWLNRVPLAHRSRLALMALMPLAVVTSRHPAAVDVIASTSGWSHGITGQRRRLIAYCHTPARWLYETPDLVPSLAGWKLSLAQRMLGPLRALDRRWASRPDHYLANSRNVRQRIARAYGRTAEVVYPPVDIPTSTTSGQRHGQLPGYFLLVARKKAYKGIDLAIATMHLMPSERLVVVGATGESTKHVTFLGRVDDLTLADLYADCEALLALSKEDLGLTPIEANAFGKPVVAWRAGGYLETINEGVNGVFFDSLEPHAVSEAVEQLRANEWDPSAIRTHAEAYGLEPFIEQLDRFLSPCGSDS